MFLYCFVMFFSSFIMFYNVFAVHGPFLCFQVVMFVEGEGGHDIIEILLPSIDMAAECMCGNIKGIRLQELTS